MHLHLQTPVKQHYQRILAAFEEDLFRALSPPFPRLNILRFDGSQPGDRIEVELVAGPLLRRWTSLITEREITPQAAWFVDEGQELPAPLTFWRHQHLITHEGNHSLIHEVIEYKTGSKVVDALLYPFLYAQFKLRKPVYQRIFGKPAA